MLRSGSDCSGPSCRDGLGGRSLTRWRPPRAARLGRAMPRQKRTDESKAAERLIMLETLHTTMSKAGWPSCIPNLYLSSKPASGATTWTRWYDEPAKPKGRGCLCATPCMPNVPPSPDCTAVTQKTRHDQSEAKLLDRMKGVAAEQSTRGANHK